jgi:hypothetical protein
MPFFRPQPEKSRDVRHLSVEEYKTKDAFIKFKPCRNGGDPVYMASFMGVNPYRMKHQMSQPSQNRVMEVVWPWTLEISSGKIRPVSRPDWIQGGIQFLIMLAMGGVVYGVFGHRIMAYAVWAFACGVLASSIWFPSIFHAIERFGKRLGRWVGTGLTYVLLVPFFYLVFVPGHVLMRLLGKDPMHRRFPSPESTCWTPRRTRMDERHYRKQFS